MSARASRCTDRSTRRTRIERRWAWWLAFVSFACAPPTPAGSSANEPSADALAVRSARDAQNAALASRDLAVAERYWVDSVVLVASRGRVIVGREAYRAAVAADTTVYQRRSATVVVSANWPLAWETGEWAGHTGSPSGPVIVSGRYSAQWVKRDNRWLIRGEQYVALACDEPACSWPLQIP